VNQILIIAAVVGLCLGSFANVLIWRLPRNQQVVRGRSACPACGHTIAWYDNLPLISWLALRGRCRHCRAAISWRYPVVELLAGAAAVLVVLLLGPGWTAAAAFLFVYLLGVIAIVDWQHMEIPHTLTVAGMIGGVLLAEPTGVGLERSLLGLGVGFLAVLALSEGYRLLRGQPGMGGGDVMLMAMVGAFLGPWAVAGVLGAGALLGTLFVLVRHGGRPAGDAKLPFGTFLAAAAVAVFWIGPAVWGWYVGLLA